MSSCALSVEKIHAEQVRRRGANLLLEDHRIVVDPGPDVFVARIGSQAALRAISQVHGPEVVRPRSWLPPIEDNEVTIWRESEPIQLASNVRGVDFDSGAVDRGHSRLVHNTRLIDDHAVAGRRERGQGRRREITDRFADRKWFAAPDGGTGRIESLANERTLLGKHKEARSMVLRVR